MWNWIYVAQNRVQWRAFVNTATNILNTWMSKISWARERLVSFSGRTLLQGISGEIVTIRIQFCFILLSLCLLCEQYAISVQCTPLYHSLTGHDGVSKSGTPEQLNLINGAMLTEWRLDTDIQVWSFVFLCWFYFWHICNWRGAKMWRLSLGYCVKSVAHSPPPPCSTQVLWCLHCSLNLERDYFNSYHETRTYSYATANSK
jgi:hypothetical protein